ncbi:MAG TPA: MarR family transcriptional regulator [Bryobacteraceae bacterium]|nr:MarR family transcriptional regulator [Bryobacteraceae bacterium]
MNRTLVPEDRRESFYHERLRQAGPGYANFDLAATELSLDLIYTCEMLHQATARYFTEFGLSKASLNVLMILRHCGLDGMQLHELGELLLVSRANITGIVDHLEEKGYVKRVVDASDRRARYPRITEKAAALLDEFIPVHYRNINMLLQELTNGEKEMLQGLLRKTRASLRTHSQQARGREAAAVGEAAEQTYGR